jgi:hypothetical protein
MNRSSALAAEHGYAFGQKLLEAANAVARPSIADTKQAEYFKALLDEHLTQNKREIRDQASALAQCRDSREAHHLRQRLTETHREQNELDRLRHRRTARLPRMDSAIRHFDIVVTRKRACWRLEIPEFDVVLSNIDCRTDAELVSRTIIAEITGLPMTQIGVRTPTGRTALQAISTVSRGVPATTAPRYHEADRYG